MLEASRPRPPRSKALNLFDRFALHAGEVMAFLLHGIPFDNNEAERSLQMSKTRQKISGCFRSPEYLWLFARLRSIIATARKNAANVLEVIQAATGESGEVTLRHLNGYQLIVIGRRL